MIIDRIFEELPTVETERFLLECVDHASGAEIARRVSPDAPPWSIIVPIAGDDPAAAQVESGTIDEPFGAHSLLPWCVRRRSDGRVVGACGFLLWSLPNSRAELALALSPGLDREESEEILRSLLRFGFETLEVNRIELRCDAADMETRELGIGSGLRAEAVLRGQVRYGGRFHDMALLAMVASDWKRSGATEPTGNTR